MGKVRPELTEDLEQFIAEQPVFFVASAPAAVSGHVNLSPKGLDTFRVLSPSRVAYLDLTGSGNETAAHLTENGRITLMFCSFSRNPKILRLYGRGELVQPANPQFRELSARFPSYPGIRQVVAIELTRVHTSCGFGVPRLDAAVDRDALLKWAESKGPARLREYRAEKNARSIDGLPAPLPESDAESIAEAHEGDRTAP
jgi:hypothetical protein